MATELATRARRNGQVATLVAHTLAQENASVRILRRLGMKQVGETIDPDDGPVWRWEMALP
jgi:[ribosomal protein S5]-alanine N-acetyltransferase